MSTALGRRVRACAITLVVLTGMGACGSDGDDAFKPSRPTTTAVGGFGITGDQREFHLSFRIERPGSNIRVLDVRALTSPNVEYLGAVTVWPKDLPGENMGFGPKFPPPKAKAVHPLREEVPAAETLFVPKPFDRPPPIYVVAGFRLMTGEIGAMNGVRVTYEADGEQATDTWPVAAIACAQPKGCKGPSGSDDPDFENRVLTEAGLLPKD